LGRTGGGLGGFPVVFANAGFISQYTRTGHGLQSVPSGSEQGYGQKFAASFISIQSASISTPVSGSKNFMN
jgi:hypothetical protein